MAQTEAEAYARQIEGAIHDLSRKLGLRPNHPFEVQVPMTDFAAQICAALNPPHFCNPTDKQTARAGENGFAFALIPHGWTSLDLSVAMNTLANEAWMKQ